MSRAEEVFQLWLDQVRGDSSCPLTPFLGAECEEVRQAVRALAADFEEVAARLHDGVAFLAPGHLVGGFELVRPLGHGSSGVVWEARQVAIDRPVALKLLHPLMAISTRAVERFRREAEAAAKLDHPGLIRVYGAGLDQGLHWIAQELVPGGRTLLDEIEAERLVKRPADFRRLARRFRDLAAAIQHAHEAGILHRDIKPGNILVGPGGDLRLGDFGLVRAEGAVTLTLTDETAGTPLYMAPELLGAGKAVHGVSSEVFSFGATLYEAVTLARAFQGGTRETVVHRILQGDFVPPAHALPSVPRDLDVVVCRCLSRDPRARFPSMAALAEDLGRFADGSPVLSRSPGPLTRAVAWARRRPARAGALLALCLLTVALFQLLLTAQAARADAENAAAEAIGFIRVLKSLVEPLDPTWDSRRTREVLRKAVDSLPVIARSRSLPQELVGEVALAAGIALKRFEWYADAAAALEMAEASHAAAGEAGREGLLLARLHLGWVRGRTGELEEAERLLREVEREARAEGRPVLLAYAMNRLGQVAFERRDYAGAEGTWLAAEQVIRDAGIQDLEIQGLNALDLAIVNMQRARLEGDDSRWEPARTRFLHARDLFLRAGGNLHPELPYVELGLASVALFADWDAVSAVEHCRQAVALLSLWLGENEFPILEAKEHLAFALLLGGRRQEALDLAGEIDALRDLQDPRWRRIGGLSESALDQLRQLDAWIHFWRPWTVLPAPALEQALREARGEHR